MAEPEGRKSARCASMPTLVRELAELLTDNALTEIEVADGDRRIRVAAMPAPVIGAPAADAGRRAGACGSAGTARRTSAPAEEIAGNTVKSPMVGTAFLSSEPGAAPFVEIGDAVKAGDTLLIVEAMKVMNPITAPAGGVVKKIFVSDAQPVEFDQPLVDHRLGRRAA